VKHDREALTPLTEALPDLRERIAAAAQELYLRDGIEGFSMRKVADLVGVSAPAIYRHFKNREELLDEIVVSGLKLLEDYLRPALDAPTPYERLRCMTENFLDFALERPRYFDSAFRVPAPGVSGFKDEIEKRKWETFRLALEQVAACMEQGLFQRDDPLQVAVTVWAEAHGLVTLYRTGRFGQDAGAFRALYRGCMERLMRGLRAERPPP
jgi:AcrR family transcriptional regulator